MSLTREEVSIQLGVNNTQLSTGLAQADGMVSTFADKVSHKFEKKFNKIFYGGLVGLAFHTFKELLPTANEFWDAVYGVGEGDAERFDQMRERFHKIAETIRGLKEKLEDLSDARILKHETDSGKDKFLSDKLAENYEKQAELRQQEEAARKASIGAKNYAQQIEQQNPEAAEYQRQRSKDKMNEAAKFLEQRMQLEIKAASLEDKLEEHRAAVKKRHDEEVEANERTRERFHQKHLDQIAKEYEAQQRAATAQRRDLEQFMPTLGELANSGFWTRRRRWRSGPFAGMAQDIQDLGEQAKEQFIWGNTTGAKNSIAERNRLYDQLADLGIVPQRAEKVAEAQIEMAETIRSIKEDGLTVIPAE